MSAADILKTIKDKEVEYVDLRFTDPKGKLQHLTQDISTVDEGMLNDGVFFDGSSIAGWKAINESDMVLKPDTSRSFIDPFMSHNTLVLFCDIYDPITKDKYERDPRSTAKLAEEYVKKSGVAVQYRSRARIFCRLDDVRFANSRTKQVLKLIVVKDHIKDMKVVP